MGRRVHWLHDQSDYTEDSIEFDYDHDIILKVGSIVMQGGWQKLRVREIQLALTCVYVYLESIV